jgi:hypothetical protein
MTRYIISLCIAYFITQPLAAQQSDLLKKNLKAHISTLASDKFEGRETGTKGEKRSYQYLSSEFKKAGINPKGTKGYLQPFEFSAGTHFGKHNLLMIDQQALQLEKEYFPLPYSAYKSQATGIAVDVGCGMVATDLHRNDYEKIDDLKGKIAVMDFATPEADNPHSKWAEYTDLRKRLETAAEKGASAVVLYNSNSQLDNPSKNSINKITPLNIPVIFVTNPQLPKLAQNKTITIKTDIEKNMLTGNNVIGYVDNQREYTIVIGAHYDHLGYGGHESLYRGEKAIHNGADDNASGTAALIEIARRIKNSNLKNYNYLFIAFSGEEKGLLGSAYFTKHPTIDQSKVNYMLNMDMVGRLKQNDQVLLINGAGTSPEWKALLTEPADSSLRIKTTESGIGPSDHTSFYLSNIPALHFFSGTHADYHKPSDDEPLINYDGMERIINYMFGLIEKTNTMPKLAFAKTNDASNDDAPRFKVTLGVVPDYTYEGNGMRIDGVTEGKPASHAGLLKGDIVIQLGDEKVADMMSYMKALSKFKKGQTTKVKVIRDKTELEKEVTF